MDNIEGVESTIVGADEDVVVGGGGEIMPLLARRIHFASLRS